MSCTFSISHKQMTGQSKIAASLATTFRKKFPLDKQDFLGHELSWNKISLVTECKTNE